MSARGSANACLWADAAPFVGSVLTLLEGRLNHWGQGPEFPLVEFQKLVSRLQAVWLLIVLVVGQVHACAGSWVLPDGTPCKACPVGPCSEESGQFSGITADPVLKAQEDCHSCCVQQACSDPEKHGKSTSVPIPNFDVAFVHTAIPLPTYEFTEPRTVHIQVESGFPNAPPGSSCSRAPPVPLS